MNNKPLVLLRSARHDSDTQKLVEALFPEGAVKTLNLLDYKLHPYSYAGEYPADDQFLHLIEELLPHQQIVFVTPVYWYAMSGLLKTFFDRFTDIVTVHKRLGRKLPQKKHL